MQLLKHENVIKRGEWNKINASKRNCKVQKTTQCNKNFMIFKHVVIVIFVRKHYCAKFRDNVKDYIP